MGVVQIFRSPSFALSLPEFPRTFGLSAVNLCPELVGSPSISMEDWIVAFGFVGMVESLQ